VIEKEISVKTTTWKIEQMERRAESGGVITAYWRATTDDDGYSATSYGSVSFTPDPASPGFVPFDSLTEDMVLQWVWASVSKAETEAALDVVIAEDKSPVVLAGTPWQT
jgi:hypothetical protein